MHGAAGRQESINKKLRNDIQELPMTESRILRITGLEDKAEYQETHYIQSYQGDRKNPLRSFYNYHRDFPCPCFKAIGSLVSFNTISCNQEHNIIF